MVVSVLRRSRSCQQKTLQSIPANPWPTILALLMHNPKPNPAGVWALSKSSEGRVKNQFRFLGGGMCPGEGLGPVNPCQPQMNTLFGQNSQQKIGIGHKSDSIGQTVHPGFELPASTNLSQLSACFSTPEHCIGQNFDPGVELPATNPSVNPWQPLAQVPQPRPLSLEHIARKIWCTSSAMPHHTSQ